MPCLTKALPANISLCIQTRVSCIPSSRNQSLEFSLPGCSLTWSCQRPSLVLIHQVTRRDSDAHFPIPNPTFRGEDHGTKSIHVGTQGGIVFSWWEIGLGDVNPSAFKAGYRVHYKPGHRRIWEGVGIGTTQVASLFF